MTGRGINTKNEYISIAEVFSYDIQAIYEKRRQNYKVLINELHEVDGIELIYPKLREGISPQSCPILILNKDRDEIFKKMNEAGFGLVSLYYHMIEPLRHTNYESVMTTSNQITNLPVHQDCDQAELLRMTAYLKELIA